MCLLGIYTFFIVFEELVLNVGINFLWLKHIFRKILCYQDDSSLLKLKMNIHICKMKNICYSILCILIFLGSLKDFFRIKIGEVLMGNENLKVGNFYHISI